MLGAAGLLLFGSVISFAGGFGEDYGWRGYLQSELFKLGRVRGVLLLGVIWGVWHWPIVLMGHTYPGHPLIGILLYLFNCICLSIVLGYAVLRSGSVLLAAFLHVINNVTVMQITNVRLMPFDNAFSFIGIYGVVPLAIVALLVLRDPIWRGKGSSLATPEPAPADMALSGNPGAVEKAADQARLGTAS
jgi:membrane protease YdiL (CAAX protease family)